MNDNGIVWINGWPTEKKTGLPCGRVFFQERFECKGKTPYDSKDEANREIYRFMVESLSNTTFLRAYKCKYCKKYHFTSKD